MADGIDIDKADISKLSSDLGRTSEAAWKNLQKAIEVTARNVRDTARENSKGLAHAPAFPYSITYDVGVGYDQSLSQAASSVLTGSISDARSTTLRAEIGPDKNRKQGALGNLIEYGSVNNPPQGIMHGAIYANEDDFERGVNIAIDDALKGLGL
ncbi:hypothetical protein [Microbacterium nanhaiense]|uniref:hypothetical protein n=1 Tax=Microbacterium nanhaiense TaxID=1301026 RepID=UPI001669EE0F|nr:hypothetical protein [Microbacterium nanhaiense]